MSLAFERTLAPPARSAGLAVAILAIGVAGAVLGTAYGWQRWGGAAAGALAAACAGLIASGARSAWFSLRAARGDPRLVPVLRVDALGRASVRWQGREFACTARHWLLADRWVALTLELDDPAARRGKRRVDWLAGGPIDDDTWRRLRVWLIWLQRGGVPQGCFDPVATGRKPLEFPTPTASHRPP